MRVSKDMPRGTLTPVEPDLDLAHAVPGGDAEGDEPDRDQGDERVDLESVAESTEHEAK